MLSYILLLVLSFSLLKNLLPSVAEHTNEDCSEFAHIHFYKIENLSDLNSLQKPQDASNDETDCHEGKSIVAYFVLHSEKLEIVKPVYKTGFEIVRSVDNNFTSPYLEPRKKPPRLS